MRSEEVWRATPCAAKNQRRRVWWLPSSSAQSLPLINFSAAEHHDSKIIRMKEQVVVWSFGIVEYNNQPCTGGGRGKWKVFFVKGQSDRLSDNIRPPSLFPPSSSNQPPNENNIGSFRLPTFGLKASILGSSAVAQRCNWMWWWKNILVKIFSFWWCFKCAARRRHWPVDEKLDESGRECVVFLKGGAWLGEFAWAWRCERRVAVARSCQRWRARSEEHLYYMGDTPGGSIYLSSY